VPRVYATHLVLQHTALNLERHCLQSRFEIFVDEGSDVAYAFQ